MGSGMLGLFFVANPTVMLVRAKSYCLPWLPYKPRLGARTCLVRQHHAPAAWRPRRRCRGVVRGAAVSTMCGESRQERRVKKVRIKRVDLDLSGAPQAGYVHHQYANFHGLNIVESIFNRLFKEVILARSFKHWQPNFFVISALG